MKKRRPKLSKRLERGLADIRAGRHRRLNVRELSGPEDPNKKFFYLGLAALGVISLGMVFLYLLARKITDRSLPAPPMLIPTNFPTQRLLTRPIEPVEEAEIEEQDSTVLALQQEINRKRGMT